MAHERQHIQSNRIFIERVEIFANGKSGAAVLADNDGGDSLRDLRESGTIIVEAAIRVIVRVDETGRHDQTVRLDYARARRNLHLTAFAGGNDRVAFHDDD